MGVRERIEREIRAALKRAAESAPGDEVRINRSTRTNAVVVRNVGGGSSAATAEQNAPIVQGPVPTPPVGDDGA